MASDMVQLSAPIRTTYLMRDMNVASIVAVLRGKWVFLQRIARLGMH
jgi:hypothetical protein